MCDVCRRVARLVVHPAVARQGEVAGPLVKLLNSTRDLVLLVGDVTLQTLYSRTIRNDWYVPSNLYCFIRD